MALILNIDTAVQISSICLANGQQIIDSIISPSEKESASWLHTAVQQLQHTGCSLRHLDAIAVSAGPGSYTGLRVGMAAAKGLCYALSKPLITINTLQLMAAAVKEVSSDLLCPMIDARRMEVFTALYDASLNEVLPSANMILDEHSFDEWLNDNTITFFGNGSTKAASVVHHNNAVFTTISHSASDMISLSAKKFEQHQFSDIAYAEPFYGKEFHSPISKKNY